MKFEMNATIALLVSPLMLAGCASDKNTKQHRTVEKVSYVHEERLGEDYEKTSRSLVETDVKEDSVQVEARRTEIVERPGEVDRRIRSRVLVTADDDNIKTKRDFDVDLMERGPDDKVVRLETITIHTATPKMVHFAYNDATLDKRDKTTLRRHVSWLMNNPEAKIIIEGHTDERGSVDYNFDLAEERAQSVMDYLVELGVERERLQVVAMGEGSPLSDAETPHAYLMNRRVELERASK